MISMAPRYNLYVTGRGNIYMRELAELIASVLEDLGRSTQLLLSGLPERRDGEVNLIVAPHEFFHFAGLDGINVGDQFTAAAASVCVTTEQMGTPWFEKQIEFCAASPLVLDINASAAEALNFLGLPARHLQLGYHPSIDQWQGKAQARRCDVAFLGASNERRNSALASMAPKLWDRQCELRLFTFEHPVTGPKSGFLTGIDKWRHLADTKILLNIHRSEIAYFEWLRAIEAIANGCVLVSEESICPDPLKPFVHFIESPLDVLGDYLLAALIDDDWLRTLQEQAYETLRSDLAMTTTMAEFLPIMESQLDSPVSPALSRPLGWAQQVIATAPDPPINELRVLLETRTAEFSLAAKDLVLSQRSGIRRLEQLEAAIEFGSTVHYDVEVTPAYETARPQVSVVLTNYNYADLVGEAIDSVIASNHVCLELVVVDDHSSDDSLRVVRTIMDTHPWFPIKLVVKHSNQGLSAARNRGFELARAEFVFVLDADNLVYPDGISKLLTAIGTETNAAFAYGMIDTFSASDPNASVGLTSCLPWDYQQLTRANYIDAMALVRRSAWSEVGGYDIVMDERFGGWEDFDLWLRFASEGYGAAFVPSPVARYRSHASSMLRSFNWDQQSAVGEFQDRYPNLPWLLA